MTGPIRPLVLVDLDDTLFQSRAKCPPHLADDALTLAATASNGNHSFMTPPQRALVDWLLATTDLVPVTARSSSAFDGVALGFAAGAILSNGALIRRPDGSVDLAWRDLIVADLARYREPIREVLAAGRASAARAGLDVRALAVGEAGVSAYVVFKDNAGTGDGLGAIRVDPALVAGWTRHHNGNNLAFIPPVVSKRRAAEHLIAEIRRREPAKPVLGLGDSLSDIPFLRLCDWWGMPARSQIADATAHLGAAETTTPMARAS